MLGERGGQSLKQKLDDSITIPFWQAAFGNHHI
jgi:hypothetical protein